MDANSGEPWSKMDIADLTHSLDYGNTFAQTASFLCRDEDEVRQRLNERGPSTWELGPQRLGQSERLELC
jgi:hypothetical protein